MKKILAALLLLTGMAHAQPVQQSGTITPGHPLRWLSNGVVGDGGSPASGLLSGLGVTYNGYGICQNSAPNTTAFNQLCIGTTTSGGGFLNFHNYGGTGGLTFIVNGVSYPFPFSGTGTVTSISAGANITITPNPCTTTCTIAASGGGGGGGTVTSVSGLNTNGFTVGVANPTSTPAITVGTSINGYLLGNGTSVSAASTTGSGNLVLSTNPTLTNETVGGTANFTGALQIAGNTMTFPSSPATLGYLIGSVTSGHCTQFSGTAGGISDAGAVCGSGGGGGGSTANRQDFVAPGGFTPGSTNSLLLSSAPVTANAVTVTFDGVTQAGNTWSLTGSTLMFNAAIPTSVAVVDVSWLSASVSLGTVTSVGLSEASSTPIFNITNSPVTSAGTLTETLKTQSANTIFAGPNTGSAAQPNFRSLVAADLPLATSSLVGGVQGDGSTLTIAAGVISCTTATSSQIGCVTPDGTIITDTAGAITVAKASSSIFGVVKVDGTTITASGGVITSVASSVTWPTSTDIVISNGTSTPNGLAEVDGNCVVGAGGVWTAGSCLGGAAVTSVGNASVDTSLTIAGTGSGPWTGNVTAKINLANVQTWTGVQSFAQSKFVLNGTTGTLTMNAAATAGTHTITWPAGTTDFSGTGGTSEVVKQTSSGGAFTVAQLACADLSDSGTACPAATGTSGTKVPLLNAANTWGAVQTFPTSDIHVLGSSTGYTAVASANAGATNYTWTLQATTDTFAGLTGRGQALSGGVEITSYSIGTVSSGTTTIDCGNSPQQYLTNGGAFTFAAPAADGNTLVLITNNGSAGAVTFSGFTAEASHGDALDTTNGHKFTVSVWRINGTADYRVVAMQ